MSAAVIDELSCAMAAVAGRQQEEAAAATLQALVPRASPQGRGHAHSKSWPTGDHGAVGAAADDDAPRMGPLEGATRDSPRAHAGGAGDAGR
jgi:hypothetical protein